MKPEILVIGATGKTGKRVARRLEARGLAVRHGTRGSGIPFDWEAPATWAAALEGMTSAYVTYMPDLAVPSAQDVIAGFVKAAEGAGLKRLVLLSQRNEPRAQACEQIVKASALEWTILQPSWFMQNFSEGGFLESVLEGEVSAPDSGAKEPWVDLDDVADVAVAALLEDGHTGQVYEITGSDLLTFEEAVARIADVTGRALTYKTITPKAFEETLVAAGFGETDAEFVATLVSEILDGKNASPSDGLQRALGRQPRSFLEFAQAAHSAGCWQ
ncbi:NAD(P)H-binding protein [Roseibium sp. RKSG952]|uniref:NmrA family NAD(P)-binding protein n=1 Tax=Roseibium sp. RKSG952 TaxID=2529384 RepID=UPI0012BB4E43|nr:NAD(P)H-binding protein [Roseibium sp. RKSG952]MTH96306.1 NmrA family transcriptional regulator [Roseibium sp. RKSG952]